MFSDSIVWTFCEYQLKIRFTQTNLRTKTLFQTSWEDVQLSVSANLGFNDVFYVVVAIYFCMLLWLLPGVHAMTWLPCDKLLAVVMRSWRLDMTDVCDRPSTSSTYGCSVQLLPSWMTSFTVSLRKSPLLLPYLLLLLFLQYCFCCCCCCCRKPYNDAVVWLMTYTPSHLRRL